MTLRKMPKKEVKLDINLEKAFMRTMKRQEIQDKIIENRNKAAELGRILSQSPERKEINALFKHNRHLGQKMALLQSEIDKIIIEAEEKYRMAKKK